MLCGDICDDNMKLHLLLIEKVEHFLVLEYSGHCTLALILEIDTYQKEARQHLTSSPPQHIRVATTTTSSPLSEMAPTPLSTFTTSPPHLEYANLTFPAPHIALVTLSRPKDLNCINSQGHLELHSVFEWLDNEPSLRVGIVTGTGRAFCAGADLKGSTPISIAQCTLPRERQTSAKSNQYRMA